MARRTASEAAQTRADLLDAATRLGRHLQGQFGGERFEQIDEATALFIARRAVMLVQDLTRRGHAAQTPVAARTQLATAMPGEADLRREIARAGRHPEWSELGADAEHDDTARARCVRAMQASLLCALRVPAQAVFTAHLASVLKTMALDGRGVAWLPAMLISDALAAGQLVEAGTPRWRVDLEVRLLRDPQPLALAAERFWLAATSPSP